MSQYEQQIPRAVRSGMDSFILTQQQANESMPTAWEDDRSLLNFDGTIIDFRTYWFKVAIIAYTINEGAEDLPFEPLTARQLFFLPPTWMLAVSTDIDDDCSGSAEI